MLLESSDRWNQANVYEHIKHLASKIQGKRQTYRIPPPDTKPRLLQDMKPCQSTEM